MPIDERERQATAALARIDALHTGLTQIALEGGDLDGIAAELGQVLDVGVAFTSTDGRERASALSDDMRTVLDEHDLVDPTGRLRVERMKAGGVPIEDGEARTLRVAAGGDPQRTGLAVLDRDATCLHPFHPEPPGRVDQVVLVEDRAHVVGQRGGPFATVGRGERHADVEHLAQLGGDAVEIASLEGDLGQPGVQRVDPGQRRRRLTLALIDGHSLPHNPPGDGRS